MLKRKQWVYVMVTILIPVALIGILSLMNAGDDMANKVYFKRSVQGGRLKLLNAIERPQDLTGSAVVTEKAVYFKTARPSVLYRTDENLKNIKSYRVPGIKHSFPTGLYYTFFDDTTAFLLDGNSGTIATASFQNAIPHVFKLPVFTRAVYITGNTFVLRSITVQNNIPDQVFIKADLTNKIVTKENALSPPVGDAGIATDGMLHYDKTTNALIYVYYYANKYICFDTSLTMKYKAVTIFPDTGYNIQTGGIGSSSGKLFTNTTASKVINWQSDVNNGLLYINSPFKAGNETSEIFNQNTVIDVYDIRKSTYVYSFYIPFYKKQKLEEFKVINNRLLAIYRHNLVLYDFHL